MAIDDNTIYGLSGAQIKELPEKINAVKGLAKVLTTADYNWPTASGETKTAVALWLLDPGVYTADGVNVKLNNNATVVSEGTFIVGEFDNSDTHPSKPIIWLYAGGTYDKNATYYGTRDNGSGGSGTNLITYVVDNLTTTSATSALSANQGKVLKDLIDTKQDELTAGNGITIAEESGALVISSTGGGADVFTTNEWNALWA